MKPTHYLTLFILAGLPVAGCQKRSQEEPDVQSPAEYRCLFTPDKIRIDGNPDEPAWKKADCIPLSFLFSPKNPPRIPSATARLLWDEQMLYVSFECEDDDIWSYSDQLDSELWRGDVAEIFIKPSTNALCYYEFIITPGGTLYDARYPSRGAGSFYRCKGWSSLARIATQIDGTNDDSNDTDTGYTIEMAIPLAVFAGSPPPAPDTVWTFGTFRYDYSKSFEDPLLLMSIPIAPHHGFHCYEAYHRLIFKKTELEKTIRNPE